MARVPPNPFLLRYLFQPDLAGGANDLGNLFLESGDFGAALTLYRRAGLIGEAPAPVWTNAARALFLLGRFDEARRLLDQVLARDSDDPNARLLRGVTRLVLGDWIGGFADYEGRFGVAELVGEASYRAATMTGRAALWRGPDDDPPHAGGGRILVFTEQGFGDNIHGVRHVRRLVALGYTVTIAAPAPLVDLFANAPMKVRVISHETLNASDECFDYWCAMMSLPHALRLTTDDTTTPYLLADEAQMRGWRARWSTAGGVRRLIGLVWHGTPGVWLRHHREIPIPALRALADRADIRWVVLQQGLDAATRAGVVRLLDAIDVGPLPDFMTTAAALTALDGFITSDTAVAHLAGALGLRAQIVLGSVADWRWGQIGSRAAAYPSLTLHRRRPGEDWSLPVGRAVAAIAS